MDYPKTEIEFKAFMQALVDERNSSRKYVTDLDFIKSNISAEGYQLLYAPLCQRSDERICNLVLRMCQDFTTELIRNTRLTQWEYALREIIDNLNSFDSEQRVKILFIGYDSCVGRTIEIYHTMLTIISEAKKLTLEQMTVSNDGCCYPIPEMDKLFYNMYLEIPETAHNEIFEFLSEIGERSLIRATVQEDFLFLAEQSKRNGVLPATIRERYELLRNCTVDNEIIELRLVKHKLGEQEPFDPSHNIGTAFLLHQVLGENWYNQNRDNERKVEKKASELRVATGVVYYMLKKYGVDKKLISHIMRYLGVSAQKLPPEKYKNCSVYSCILKKDYDANDLKMIVQDLESFGITIDKELKDLYNSLHKNKI